MFVARIVLVERAARSSRATLDAGANADPEPRK